jgi:ATP-dependent RNA helicase DeaD
MDTPPDHPVHDDGGFAALGLRPELVSALNALGYEEPTPIQREAIPLVLAGRDLLGQADTGTGKTAAFALPALQLAAERNGGDLTGRARPAVLVLVPTRELAVQVSEAVYKYGHDLGARVAPIYGGQHIGRQLQTLDRGVHVIVATPGRALDHLNRGTLPLSDLGLVILDEADEMLDMGFADDLEAILEACPTQRQTLLFSATMPARMEKIAQRHLRDPERLRIGRSAGDVDEAPLVRQLAFVVARAHKPAALGRILDVEAPEAAIVFCRTRGEVDQLTETLNGRGYRAEALHGGMDQDQRERVLGRLRSGTTELLVATDVAARGLDIDRLSHVINYDVPSAPEAYTHRIGRVGRAGRTGTAITLAEPRERRLLGEIEKRTRRAIVVQPVPTVAALRAAQLEQTLTTVREAIAGDDVDAFRDVAAALAEELGLDVGDVAAAALALVHRANVGPVDEVEIPDIAEPKRKQQDRDARGARDDRGPRPARGDAGAPRRQLSDQMATAKIFIGAGRAARMRPNDLVGAIANETRLSGKEIGAIQIAEHHSVVEVPASAVDEVIEALRNTAIRGRHVTVRRYKEDR